MIKQILKTIRVAMLLIGMSPIFLMLLSYPASAISLKPDAVITGQNITVGDLFNGLRSAAKDKVLGPAPRPGQDMVLNARTLMRIAVAMDLSWRPQSSSDYIVLTSAATIVDHDLIKDGIIEKLKDKGITGDLDLSFADTSRSEIILPYDAPMSVEIQSITINADRDWFDAMIVAPSMSNPIQTARISGRIDQLVDVPVLSSSISNGTIIGKSDIVMTPTPARHLQGQDVILDENKLLGMTARRTIISGKMIKQNDLQAPQIVGRGQTVTMVFNNNGLSLTAMGRALQNGAKGDMIRVVNAESNRTIDAMITGDQEVEVQTF